MSCIQNYIMVKNLRKFDPPLYLNKILTSFLILGEINTFYLEISSLVYCSVRHRSKTNRVPFYVCTEL